MGSNKSNSSLEDQLKDALKADILFNRGQTYAAIGGHENFKKAIVDFEASLEY